MKNLARATISIVESRANSHIWAPIYWKATSNCSLLSSLECEWSFCKWLPPEPLCSFALACHCHRYVRLTHCLDCLRVYFRFHCQPALSGESFHFPPLYNSTQLWELCCLCLNGTWSRAQLEYVWIFLNAQVVRNLFNKPNSVQFPHFVATTNWTFKSF